MLQKFRVLLPKLGLKIDNFGAVQLSVVVGRKSGQ